MPLAARASVRPEFSRLLERLELGDELVSSSLDRLGRDSLDIEQTHRRMEETGVAGIVLQLGKTDLTSTAGKLIQTVIGAVADMERSLLVERTQAGLARAKAEGKALGRQPKTTEEQRVAMRLRADAGATISALARDYGISRASVLGVVRSTRRQPAVKQVTLQTHV